MQTIYLLTTYFNDKKYYVIDLDGNLSRSIKDSLIFLSKDSAEQYIPAIERELEYAFGIPHVINAEQTNLMSIVSDTLFERISCSGNNN